MNQQTCAHHGCRCPVYGGREFCSPTCAEPRPSSDDGTCGCGHGGCGPNEEEETSDPPE